MMIVECQKEIRLIKKKIKRNLKKIQEYSSAVSTEPFPFETEEEQREQVDSLIQNNIELALRSVKLKKDMEYTSVLVEATIDGMTKTISEWIQIRRHEGQLCYRTYKALNTKQGDSRLRYAPPVQGGTLPQVVSFFDIRTRDNCLSWWHDVIEKIDSTIEVINATTEITEAP